MIVRLKIMKKSHMSYLSLFMRYNEFSVLITFTKNAPKVGSTTYETSCITTTFTVSLTKILQ